MPIYISMLRGINVGANKRIKMERLRTSFQALGFDQVSTYIQSGNVIFKSAKIAQSALSRRIEERLLADFGFSVSVILRTSDEMAKAIQNNPFFKNPGIDPQKLHLAFLSDTPSAAALRKLATSIAAPDQFHYSGKEVYLYLPNGVSGGSLMKTSLDRILSLPTTTRNWRTVNAVHQICVDCR